MIRIGYISGRYRHLLANGSFNVEAMNQEILDEQKWARIIAECGCMWIAPITNSVFLEGVIAQNEFIVRDKAVIRRLRPNYDIILMRPNWDEEPESVGAREEYDAAQEVGLLAIHGKQGEEEIRRYLTELTSYKE